MGILHQLPSINSLVRTIVLGYQTSMTTVGSIALCRGATTRLIAVYNVYVHTFVSLS